ncbi:hypothetical protein AEST_11930 [Alishewanella aestuarii B11]|uniref:Uncharacterized protein n=1 Tax=Alishewanella aestuarii B11 TaxID=1197174 RepID=J1QKJ4_9ALTE|nr:hypothetical protein AEST_11930 [Alishewanella aestuarii B11]
MLPEPAHSTDRITISMAQFCQLAQQKIVSDFNSQKTSAFWLWSTAG